MGEITKHNLCLLITGTIVPNSNFVVHTNVEERRREYFDNLVFYSNMFPGYKIFFLENSSYDFSLDGDFTSMLSDKKIELVKFPVSDKFEQGKGYQEFEMLDKQALNIQSYFKYFVKITGRYRVLNLNFLLPAKDFSLVADAHKKPAVVQTNVFLSSLDFYLKNFVGLYKQVDDSKGIFIEKIIYTKIFSAGLHKAIYLFDRNPIITGISGSYGGTLKRNKHKLTARNIERKILKLFNIRQFLIEY